LRTCSVTLAIVSPGSILKFTTAVAVVGKILSWTPAVKIVGAIVVRMAALVTGEAAICLFTTGSKTQRFASAIFFDQAISGPRNSSICRVAPPMRDGKGAAARFCRARLNVLMAVSAGGIELWPPPAWTDNFRLT